MTTTAIVVAAGSSSRMGTFDNKIYLNLHGIPVLNWSLKLFCSCPLIDNIILVVVPSEKPRAAELIKNNGFSKVTNIVAGGASRTASVREALAVLPAGCNLVAIHDGARPLLEKAQLLAVLAAAKKTGAAILAEPVTDTIKQVDEAGHIVATLPRETLWQAQTPQVFRADIIKNAYAQNLEATDDAFLVEALGQPIVIVPGEKDNIKLTVPADLLLAELIIEAREGKK